MIPRSRNARIAAASLVVLILVAGGVLAYALANDRPSDVSHPNVSFTAPATPPVPPPVEHAKSFEWPVYGFTPARTRFFPLATPA